MLCAVRGLNFYICVRAKAWILTAFSQPLVLQGRLTTELCKLPISFTCRQRSTNSLWNGKTWVSWSGVVSKVLCSHGGKVQFLSRLFGDRDSRGLQKANRVCKVLWCTLFQAMEKYNLLLQLNNLRRAAKCKK